MAEDDFLEGETFFRFQGFPEKSRASRVRDSSGNPSLFREIEADSPTTKATAKVERPKTNYLLIYISIVKHPLTYYLCGLIKDL